MSKEEEINKELRELLERVKKIILILTVGFKDKNQDELESMQKDIRELDRKLMGYTKKLRTMQKFKLVLDSFDRKDDFKTMFETYCSEIHYEDDDDIPF